MKEPTRKEVEPFGEQAFNLRYVGKRIDELNLKEWVVYGIFHLNDLRPKKERDSEE